MTSQERREILAAVSQRFAALDPYLTEVSRRVWAAAEAETIGPHTARLFERIMNDKPHPEMGYRGCLGIIRLAEKYSAQRVEAASERALLTGACRYKSVESILKNSLDQTPVSPPPPASTPPHDNIRGAGYFDAVR